MLEKFASDSEPARSGTHVQILEIQPWLAEERREGWKEQGVAHRLAVQACGDLFDPRAMPEQRGVHVTLRRDHLVRELLIRRKLVDQRENQRHILRCDGSDLYL